MIYNSLYSETEGKPPNQHSTQLFFSHISRATMTGSKLAAGSVCDHGEVISLLLL